MVKLPEQVEISIGLDDAEDMESLRHQVARHLELRPSDLPELRLLKRSLDARKGKIRFHLLFLLGGEAPLELGFPHPREVASKERVLIVGDGPAGLFCAYELARYGIASVVVDRGKQVQPRRRDLKLLNARGGVDPDSNYCFGEGGAGTYSDGKLYTRSHKRGSVRDVLEVLALHGAPSSILTDARPHIGSNLLPEIITAMRLRLESVGVEFRFRTKLTTVFSEGIGEARRVAGARLQSIDSGEESELACSRLVLATGHSARDIFEMASRLRLELEPKSFAVGVRIEHPQALINEIQYGSHAGHAKLGAASYRIAREIDGRGVFSFCMCPGGWIVPASTDPEHLVVNGMSLSKRDSDFANSGLVVAVEVEDYQKLGLSGPLGGIELQKRAEAAGCEAGGGENRAPATRVSDFMAKRSSSTLPASSYLPGLTATNIGDVLAKTGLDLAQKMRAGLAHFGKHMRGFTSEEALLIGIESRTSSPVRIIRDAESLSAVGLQGLYPAGEGGGYAGGIVSAAVDGIRVAQAIGSELGVRIEGRD